MPPEGEGSHASQPSSARRKLRGDNFIGRAMRFISDDGDDRSLKEVLPLVDRAEAELPTNQPFHDDEFIRLMLLLAPSFLEESKNLTQRYHRLHGMARFLVFILWPRIEAQDDEYCNERFDSLRGQLSDLEGVDIEYGPANPRMDAVYDGLMELATCLGLANASR